MALNSVQINLGVFADYTDASGGGLYGTGFSRKPGIAYNKQWANGTTAEASDVIHAASYSVVAGSPLLLNLLDGSLKQPDGVTSAVFAEVCGMGVHHNGVTVGQILTLGGGTNAWARRLGATGTYDYWPGTVEAWQCPLTDAYGPVDATHKILQWVASSGTISFDLIVWGHSVA